MNSPKPPFGNHAQARSRNVTAVLGPTNTGKTHLAIERMLGHATGVIGLPLRLLAREVYDKVAARVGAGDVALITGEEKIKPERPRYHVCTVEAMPQGGGAHFLAIDEIQLAADAERGHVFTDRLLHARGEHETLLLGAATMREAVRELLPGANLVSRPRLSTLAYAGQKKLSRLPRRTAVVAFSASDVYAIAELVRRQRGGAAVVLGALSPRTRNAQVELYQNGEVDFLVATDAIGMGLNLDVDHVAFAGTRKFDGQQHRELTAAELGQIAGRAGRHMNDGTFGVTASVEPFDSELVRRLEAHEFEAVKLLQWRNRDLDFASLERLKESLRATPRERRLMRARAVDDVQALETVGGDPQIAAMAGAPAAVRLLWEVCQIPDYRKISDAAHAELVAAVYKFLMTEPGHIPEDWFARQVEQAARTEGDIDTLANRIAHIRTWTFVSHRSEWLADADHWQERSREIEDALSDALHERLTQRFVDRRTSVLMKRLRDKDGLNTEIAGDGAIHVEQHFVGRLRGFQFTPDPGAEGIHGKAARHAAAKVLARELAARAERLVASGDTTFVLSRAGRILWQGEEVARLTPGEVPLKPGLALLADEQLAAPDRERVMKRLGDWLEAHIGERLKPLVDLSRADDVSGLARGVAFRLTECFGVLKREDAAEEIRALDQEARGQLRQYGVRFGAVNIHIPALLKPAASELVVLLWALHAPPEMSIDPARLPEPPRPGLTSAEADPALPDSFYRAAGFHLCGRRAVRIDMLERLADMIRPLVAWRPGPDAAVGPAGATGDGAFRVQPDMMSIVGCSGEDFAAVLLALGFHRQRRKVVPAPVPETTPADADAAPAEPATAVETGGAAPVSAPDPLPPAEMDAAPPTAEATLRAAPAEAELAFEDVWRPRRKGPREDGRRTSRAAKQRERGDGRAPRRRRGPHEARSAEGATGKPQDAARTAEGATGPASGATAADSWAHPSAGGPRGRGKRRHKDGAGREARPHGAPRAQRPEEPEFDPDSPFAALAELKAKLSARSRERA